MAENRLNGSRVSKERLTEIVEYFSKYSKEDTMAHFDISAATIERYEREYKNSVNPAYNPNRSIIKTAEGPNFTIVSKSTDIRTLEQLIAFCKVDLSIWEVKKHVVNMWGSEANANFQVKAWLSRLKPELNDEEEILNLIEEAKEYAPKYPEVNRIDRSESGNLLEVSLFDHHYGQLSWGKETGDRNYDVKISKSLALSSIDYLLSRAEEVNIDRILLPIGNDFFNVDNAFETTIHGTRQAEDDRWKKTFISGRHLWIEIIEKCLSVAPVTIKIIPGNHDGERIFYLGDALECWFHHSKEVDVDNSPPLRKYCEWGHCFIGYTHGDREPKGTLINIMATEKPLEWSRTKYREWHKGHLHAANIKAFQILDEERGVREWILPSLVALDDWHSGKGYSSLRESMAMVWNKDKGKTDIFMYHPD